MEPRQWSNKLKQGRHTGNVDTPIELNQFFFRIQFILYRNFELITVSNAFERSLNIASIWFPISKSRHVLWVNLINCVTVLKLLLKPCLMLVSLAKFYNVCVIHVLDVLREKRFLKMCQ